MVGQLYQIDCSVASSGKKLSITKRRIRWRWGFANETEIARGSTGVECRGEEHEITLIWSITGGKQYVLDDGNQIHYSNGKRVNKFQHCWSSHKDHIFTIIAHATPPMSKRTKEWKQFELLVDGRSFDHLPHIYELGLGRESSFRQPALHSAPQMEYRVDENAGREAFVHNARGEYPQWNNQSDVDTSRELNSSPLTTFETKRQISSNSNVEVQDLLSGPTSVHDCFDTTPNVDVYSSPGDMNFSSALVPYEVASSRIMDAFETSETSFSSSQVVHPVRSNYNHQVQTSFSGSDNQDSTDSPRSINKFDEIINNLVDLQDLNSPATKPFTRNDVKSPMNGQASTLSELKKKSSGSGSSKEIMKTFSPVSNARLATGENYGAQYNHSHVFH